MRSEIIKLANYQKEEKKSLFRFFKKNTFIFISGKQSLFVFLITIISTSILTSFLSFPIIRTVTIFFLSYENLII